MGVDDTDGTMASIVNERRAWHTHVKGRRTQGKRATYQESRRRRRWDSGGIGRVSTYRRWEGVANTVTNADKAGAVVHRRGIFHRPRNKERHASKRNGTCERT